LDDAETIRLNTRRDALDVLSAPGSMGCSKLDNSSRPHRAAVKKFRRRRQTSAAAVSLLRSLVRQIDRLQGVARTFERLRHAEIIIGNAVQQFLVLKIVHAFRDRAEFLCALTVVSKSVFRCNHANLSLRAI
jgi:hypothetical protein